MRFVAGVNLQARVSTSNGHRCAGPQTAGSGPGGIIEGLTVRTDRQKGNVRKRSVGLRTRGDLWPQAHLTRHHYPITSDTTERDKRLCNIIGYGGPLPDRHASVICASFTPLTSTLVATGEADSWSYKDNLITWASKNELYINTEETMAEMEQYKAGRRCLKCVVGWRTVKG
jgi:hypothetical protein